jgi:hypothetical protein
MNLITAHRDPWNPGRLWQVIAFTGRTRPAVAPCCSHTNRAAADLCARARDMLAVITNRGATPDTHYDIRRTPNRQHRTDEENGVPCTQIGYHYCPRLGTWMTNDITTFDGVHQ